MENPLSKFNTSKNGLTNEEVIERQNKYGLNKIEDKKPTHLVILFLEQFVDILIGLLLIAAAATYVIGDVIDAGVIVLAVLLNVVMGFIQEYRSQKAMESLKSLIVKKAAVKRNNIIEEINSENITIGDIVVLDEGDKVPADLIIIEANDMTCDESTLTGESAAVSKEVGDELFMDTNILSGNCLGVVKSIGMNTQIGEIAKIIQEDDEETPLKIKVRKLGKTLSVIAIIVCIAIFILESFKGIPIVETFMTAVSLAVARSEERR